MTGNDRLEPWPQHEVHTVKVRRQRRYTPRFHEPLMVVGDVDHEEQPNRIKALKQVIFDLLQAELIRKKERKKYTGKKERQEYIPVRKKDKHTHRQRSRKHLVEHVPRAHAEKVDGEEKHVRGPVQQVLLHATVDALLRNLLLIRKHYMQGRGGIVGLQKTTFPTV